MKYHMGLDVGSTTVKLVVLDQDYNTVYSVYRRHRSDVKETVSEVIREAYPQFKHDYMTVMVTGSGGMFVEKYLGIPFVQEVVSGTTSIRHFLPDTDVCIELGGEDSKITYLSGNIEQRMNSICAGGTGAFIDQMASLLDTDASGLDVLAKNYKKIYPIASRCGVFAKTDIQALLNQGASNEDIAISVFQSVVNQTISNLACGRPIKGNIAFLGGPLHFLPALRERFMETLDNGTNKFYTPEDAQLYVAKGAAIASAKEAKQIPYLSIIKRLDSDIKIELDEKNVMDRLFESKEEYEQFQKDHETSKVVYGDLSTYQGECYLGIDAGSTTSKVVLIGEEDQILYTHYANNKGKPLELVISVLQDIYSKISKDAKIVSSGITGYGEDFIKAALHVDNGEVETIAHYTAAKYFNENVDFILDIGGQDMKAMHIKDGIIDSIQLNEACSSGCGSFLETFAKSVNMSVSDFQKEAILARNPVDLGSRCTVFMNSKVKQAQKEGSEVGDIAAGLCYSVIKNALQKVIKVRDPKKLGDNIVVQGGTFYGDAILRAFEKISGRQAIRPSISGLMGAMGMALIAKDRSTGVSGLAGEKELQGFSYEQRSAQCGRCTNNCTLSINIFPDGKRYITGNRCERGAGVESNNSMLPNLYEYKFNRLFGYDSLTEEEAIHGQVGIPRVLNIYENYPFWHTFFTKLGFQVVVSEKSSRKTYEKGIDSISSETACYPAKIAHGHIEDLVERGLKFIFYPSVFYEYQEYEKADNNINCPVVAGYPEVIVNNVGSLVENNVSFLHPFISFQDKNRLTKRLQDELGEFSVDGKTITLSAKAIKNAVEAAWTEQESYKDDVRREGFRAMEYIRDNKLKGIVLAGRPYHIDHEINHGIPELLSSMGLVVLSEDAVAANVKDMDRNLRVLDQWVYHSRLYRAAEYVGTDPDLEMIQLNSFGCGIDAVTTDQVNEILTALGKIYTVLKIDEVSNLGAVKIRVRSLIQALEGKEYEKPEEVEEFTKVEFTAKMRENHTILVPAMAPDHFDILQSAMSSEGYNFEFLKRVDQTVIDEGLKYVNNDSCYPSITVVGQLLEAVNSGLYDVNNISLLMVQTGGACRASNYVGYIRKALKEAGQPQIPVIALSAQNIETSPGLKITFSLIKKAIFSLILGDLLMRVANETRPYEVIKGSTNLLKDQWIERLRVWIQNPTKKEYLEIIQEIISDFEKLEIKKRDIPKVGIVGEILVKYLPEANNHLQDILEQEGAEVIVPDMMDFMMYASRNAKHKADLLSKGFMSTVKSKAIVEYLEYYRRPVRRALQKSERFTAPLLIEEIEAMASEVVSLGNQYGEGWLLTGEMIELIHAGAPNIVCIQPFGCLPNHITGKGVMKRIRELYPKANIVAIDYDPGASEVNQVNRIKLMMASAREQLKITKDASKVGAGSKIQNL